MKIYEDKNGDYKYIRIHELTLAAFADDYERWKTGNPIID